MKKVRMPSPGRTSYTLRQKSLILRMGYYDTNSRPVRDILMPMRWRQIRDWLLPDGAEKDEGFYQEILSASYLGARVVVAVETTVAVLALAGLMPKSAALELLLVAAATFGIAVVSAVYPHLRLLVWISTTTASVIAVRSILAGASTDFALGTATFLMLALVTAVPLLPSQSFAMGSMAIVAGLNGGHVFFFGMLAVMSTAISAALYSRRREQYRLYLDTLPTTARLRDIEAQAVRAEGSATMIRLTAALAHELSQPIGALASGLDTLLAVSARQAQTPPEGQPRLLKLQADLRVSLNDSLERLRKMVNRIQRLTNLDEAVKQPANVNELVSEAVGLMKPQSPPGTCFELDLQPVPNVNCRPQRVIAVLCSLLSNSFQALNGEGRIAVSTSVHDSLLELKIEDNGRGIPADQLPHIFDPRFQVTDGRVSTGNWSLFTSRQYMKEDGGDIRIRSREGKGTTVCLTLRVSS